MAHEQKCIIVRGMKKQRIIGRIKECERGEEVMIGSELGL